MGSEDTREKLLTSARRILDEKGYLELTIRSAAKAAGLSPGAPYRHFEHGFPELLAVLALTGFEEMLAALVRGTRSDDPRERILEISLAYVRFGVEKPDLYRVMFSSRLARPVELHDELFEKGEIPYSSRKTYEKLAGIKREAFDAIVQPLAEAQRKGALNPGDPKEFALALAALVHGLVGEFIDEGLGIRGSRKQPWSKERLAMSRLVVELLLKGLDRER